MLRNLRKEKAQIVGAEYVLTFFLVVGMMVSMTIYVRRALQARIRDVRIYAVNRVETESGDRYNGHVYLGYDPYYQNTMSNTYRRTEVIKQLSGGGVTGIFTKTYNTYKRVDMFSNTAAPKFSD